MPYNEIYGCHRRGLRSWLSTVCKDEEERRRIAIPRWYCAIIIIEFPFDSRLPPHTPEEERSRLL